MVFRPLTLKERALCLFFPARCLNCGRAVLPERLFCEECAAILPKEPFFRKFPLDQAPDKELAVTAPLFYEEGFRQTLHRLKFQEEWGICKPLALVMAQAAAALPGEYTLVTWVPMSDKKLRMRGYNQSALLGKEVAKELGLPWREALEQTRETETQHLLNRPQRADNVRDAYRAMRRISGERVLLVDDIVTTGATLRSCAQALYEGGAAWVGCLCAAGGRFSQLEQDPEGGGRVP